MGLFNREPRSVRLDAPLRLDPGSSVNLAAGRAPWSLWADGMGKLSIRALQLILVVVVAAAVFLGIQQITVVTIPLVLALILASAFAPVMSWMRRHGVPAVLATLITLLAIVAVLGGITWLIVWAVRDQWSALYGQAEEGIQSVVAWVSSLNLNIDQAQIDEWIGTVTDFVTSAQFGSGALAGVGAVANFITGLVLLVTMLFFFLKDGPQMWAFLLRPFRGENYERAVRIGDKTVSTLGSYVRGTAAVAAVDAIGIGIGLWILQVPLWLPLSVLVFVLAFIPIVGATVAGILAALVALVANGWVVALIVVGIVVLVNQLEGNFLQPVLMGRSMKLHAFVILIALTIGTVLSGIIGAILAVPITAVAWGAVQVWDGESTPARWARRKPSEADAGSPERWRARKRKKDAAGSAVPVVTHPAP
ncbi:MULTISPECIES: AI-2E family transporter [unclassified Microbacterium]|uniref:AI-2E family transporter n=1 Tax=unclassified Microbacterium TaxID=2609290 RepID=UPI00214C2042|nr:MULTISPECIES: AI-2E family transporter [unclassified Microbacterium]MCR2785088.1 AI-2E family transporter [Microbacterium sp. zg.B96]MDL5352448.1 AI-2E family transporter [Microbacterium sp. zg-YB36]WIM16621.1 AI-2E family transporter [Microbacterium sp. zg-B96]